MGGLQTSRPSGPDEGSMKTKEGAHPVLRRVFVGIIRHGGVYFSNNKHDIIRYRLAIDLKSSRGDTFIDYLLFEPSFFKYRISFPLRRITL